MKQADPTAPEAKHHEARTTMDAHVYHITIPSEHLPSDQQDIQDFCRDYVLNLIGWETRGIDFSGEEESHQGPVRIVITVPEDRTEVLERMAAAGQESAHTEPTRPEAYENRVVIPRAFQVRHLGDPIHPTSVCNNPTRMLAVSNALAEHTDHLPSEATNCWMWESAESDEETQVLTIYW